MGTRQTCEFSTGEGFSFHLWWELCDRQDKILSLSLSPSGGLWGGLYRGMMVAVAVAASVLRELQAFSVMRLKVGQGHMVESLSVPLVSINFLQHAVGLW